MTYLCGTETSDPYEFISQTPIIRTSQTEDFDLNEFIL